MYSLCCGLLFRDHYVTKVSWKDDTRLVVVWANRIQNRAITTFCDMFLPQMNETCVMVRIYRLYIDDDPVNLL